MSREWKPGEAVAVDWMGTTYYGFVDTDGGFYTTDQRLKGVTTATLGHDMRPLVVIDPEDGEQVERLRLAVQAESKGFFTAHVLAAALREFANPTPPKPDEPTGLGAVVEDGAGQTWMRDWKGYWRAPDVTARWAKVEAVRVLSEGVAS